MKTFGLLFGKVLAFDCFLNKELVRRCSLRVFNPLTPFCSKRNEVFPSMAGSSDVLLNLLWWVLCDRSDLSVRNDLLHLLQLNVLMHFRKWTPLRESLSGDVLRLKL